MNNAKKFRIINDTEREIIIRSVLKISVKILSVLDKIGYKISIAINNKNTKNNFPLIFLIPKNLFDKINQINPEINIISVGLYFGFIKKGEFYLSLEGAEFLRKHGCFSEKQQLYVTEEGEKSILYGNNISKKMVFKISNNIKNNDFLLILNKLNEVISIAKSLIDYSTYQNVNQKSIVAQNLIDKGYYLRKNQ